GESRRLLTSTRAADASGRPNASGPSAANAGAPAAPASGASASRRNASVGAPVRAPLSDPATTTVTRVPASRDQPSATPAARLSAASRFARSASVGSAGSHGSPTSTRSGDGAASYSRTISSPRRADDRQWTDRRLSPARYGRTPRTSAWSLVTRRRTFRDRPSPPAWRDSHRRSPSASTVPGTGRTTTSAPASAGRSCRRNPNGKPDQTSSGGLRNRPRRGNARGSAHTTSTPPRSRYSSHRAAAPAASTTTPAVARRRPTF